MGNRSRSRESRPASAKSNSLRGCIRSGSISPGPSLTKSRSGFPRQAGRCPYPYASPPLRVRDVLVQLVKKGSPKHLVPGNNPNDGWYSGRNLLRTGLGPEGDLGSGSASSPRGSRRVLCVLSCSNQRVRFARCDARSFAFGSCPDAAPAEISLRIPAMPPACFG